MDVQAESRFFLDKRHMPGFINKAPGDQIVTRLGHYKQGTGTASSTRGETNILTPNTKHAGASQQESTVTTQRKQ
jgi:hypothetical protein